MGAYVNPPKQDKIAWLTQHAEPTTTQDPEKIWNNKPDGQLPICLVDNRAFYALGIGYCEQEVQDFAHPDGRMKLWYYAPITELHKVSPELEGYLRYAERG